MYGEVQFALPVYLLIVFTNQMRLWMSVSISFKSTKETPKRGDYYKYIHGGGIFIMNTDLKLVSLVNGHTVSPTDDYERIRGTITIEVS